MIHIKQVDSINIKSSITSMSTFPSGNIILVSSNNNIQIFNMNFNIIQFIENAHEKGINYIYIKDENNFVTCSRDKNIKTWIKNIEYKNQFVLNKTIINAHDNEGIYKVIYFIDNLISCSKDKSIKIWEKNNKNQYQNITILLHSDSIRTFLLLKDKNILISSGFDGTKFWNLNNYECLIYIKEAICGWWNALKRIDKNRIIIGNENGYSKIISISKKTIIKEFETFSCYSVCVVDKRKIFITGGYNNIKLYQSDNYETIQTILDNQFGCIYGIIELKNGFLLSYGRNGKIRVWSF